MTPKEYLLQYRETMERSAEIELHLHELKVEAYKLEDHEGHSVKLDAATIRYVDACNAMAEELDRLQTLREQICGVIERVQDPAARSVLYARYINGMSWKEIEGLTHYSHQHVVGNIHQRGLKLVKDLIEFDFGDVV